MGRAHIFGSLLVVGALCISACADDGAKSSSSAASAPNGGQASGAIAGGGSASGVLATKGTGSTASAATGSTAPESQTSGAVTPLVPSTEVVYTGQLDVRVANAEAAAKAAQDKIQAIGGYLYSQHSATDGDAARSVMVFKVPPGSFLAALDSLAALGKELQRDVQADDVTAQLVDLESRLTTAQASLARTRELLARAQSIPDLASVEAELTRRETAVEQIKGQIRVLQGQVSAGTITLTVGQKLKGADPSDDLPGFLDGLRGGFRALRVTLSIILLVTLALLPFVPVVLLVGYGWRRVNHMLEPRRARARAQLEQRRYEFSSYRTWGPQPPPPQGPAPQDSPAQPASAAEQQRPSEGGDASA